MTRPENTVDLSEVYFLIAHFLADSPLTSAAKVLIEELEQKKLLPKRIDWQGVEQEQQYSDVVTTHSDVNSSHLVSLLGTLNTLLNRHGYTALPGLNSLLTLSSVSKVKRGGGVKLVSIAGRVARRAEFHLNHYNAFMGKNYLPSLLTTQYCSRVAGKNLLTPSFFATARKFTSILGHLAPVYCCTYDRTGHRIITGADDCLLKIWSSFDGRLLGTLRGHSGEVSDIAVSHNNTLIASGSTDKTIRVWCAQTTAPVAILTGHHGIITSLQFSPIMYEDYRGILTSTSSDGHLFMWSYNTATNEFDKTPVKIMEKTRVGDQTVCSCYSPGGYYLVTGGTDHVIRVYKMYPTPVPEPWELSGHTDRIMIVKFGHTTSSLFATGSRDGTARIWCFKSGQWQSTMLQMPKQAISDEDVCHRHKLQVTMVGWEWTDHYVITASTPDCNMYVWDVNTATITHSLQGHMGEVFVVEPHPYNIRVLLSAGHDGLVKLWDMFTGTCIKTFRNLYIEEESESSVFDCRFSPDGLTFAATDALGHVILFGFGDKWAYRKFPDEQFFHTDYRPLIWDRENNVLDEESQRPPHLMPPPYLVDIDGHPHPLKGQSGILELIRPPSHLNVNKNKEDVDVLVDYDEFMKQRQVQLASDNKQLTKGGMNCLLKTGENKHVPQNNRGTLYDDQPCCSSSASSQVFSQSQDSNVTMETDQTDNTILISNNKTEEVNSHSENSAYNKSLSNGDTNSVQTEENGLKSDNAILNGHSVVTSEQHMTSLDHQSVKNANQSVDFDQNRQLNSQAVVNDETVVNGSADFVDNQKHQVSDQTVVNNQAAVNDQTAINDQVAANDHAAAVNDQAAVSNQAEVNNQAVVNNQAAVNDQQANNNDEINILEFDNSEESGIGNNNNILSSIVWSCGLSDQEAKNAVSMWLSRTVIPHLDTEVYGLQRSKLDYQLNEEIKFHERESSKAAALQEPPETINVDSNKLTTRAQGKSLRSGKRLPDVMVPGFGGGAEVFVDEDNGMDNISISDSEEDDGFNHWSSNEGSYISSSDVSDWTMEAAINITSLGRKSTRRHRTRLHNSNNSDGEEFNEVIDEDPITSTSADHDAINTGRIGNNRYKAYLPPAWLKQTTAETSPYFPQVGDMVVYCRQGHELYLQEVRQKRLNYHLKGQKLPWQKYTLEPHELCQVKNVHFIVGPPTVCSITLSMVFPQDAPTSSLPKTFSFKYHDIDDVPDFLILASKFCTSICHPWKEDVKFQSFIEGSWWTGKIISREPFSPMYPQSLWQCYIVQWDDDNITDTLSPWDMEPLPEDEDTSPDLTNLNLFTWRYVEPGDEWAPNGIDAERRRIVKGIEVVMETMEEAAPFKEPVDLILYPDYCVAVAMPTDLSTIRTKLNSRFYPRKTALLWEVILLYRNTLAYNEDDSLIVKHAKILILTLHSFISDSSCEDVMSCYQPDQAISDTDIVINNPSPLAMNDEVPEEPAAVRPKRNRLVSAGDSDEESSQPKRSKDEPEWMSHAHHLLNTISSHHCAIPFLDPVDTRQFTDYHHYVKQPMDLSTVLVKLESSQYAAPVDFIQDIRLIFNNSRIYNSHPKNQIHQMTIKLEDYFEEHVVRFLTQCGGNEIKYATRGAINKVASSTSCGSTTQRKLSSSNNEDELEEEEEEEEEEEDEEMEEEEEYDAEEDEDDVKAELLSLCDDDEISVEDEQRKNTIPRKSPRKKQAQTNNTNGTGMKLRNRSYLRGKHKQRHRSSSTFSNSSESENDSDEPSGSHYGKGKNSVVITSHGRRVKPNTRLKQ